MTTANHTTLLVKGMTCGGCARSVAEALLGVEGVDDVEVRLEDGRVRVVLNEHEPADREALIRAVDDAGYTVDRIEMA